MLVVVLLLSWPPLWTGRIIPLLEGDQRLHMRLLSGRSGRNNLHVFLESFSHRLTDLITATIPIPWTARSEGAVLSPRPMGCRRERMKASLSDVLAFGSLGLCRYLR
ncbi:hypothetical protein QBC43DRAFT_128700 [Cladorrhinum sp. PSN259]|nr:hypothetical protein QBC43DRAFT_128700 [Cladorrhinum sp. PSN259]